ncbi:MAG: glycosyltransferase, partial [Anaerolineae bacterium]
VVATSVCNHGLGATPGEHLLTADTAEAFAAAVLALLRDPEARARMGSAGQRFIQTHYDTEAAIAQWEAAFDRLQKSHDKSV